MTQTLAGRLAGLETEYAIRFEPDDRDDDPKTARPSNEQIYGAIAASLGALVPTAATGDWLDPQRVFTANGGSVYFEASARHDGHGLVEGATPECRGPAQLLLYQRAQDEALRRSLPGAQARLADAGFSGRLGLLKNCRDAQGNTYGAQENYEVELASGGTLAAYRGLLILLAILGLVPAAATWALMAALFAVYLGLVALSVPVVVIVVLAEGASPRVGRPLGHAIHRCGDRGFGLVVNLIDRLTRIAWAIIGVPHLLGIRLLAFRPQRRAALAFLASRPLLSGAGTVRDTCPPPPGRETEVCLSEKACGIKGVLPLSPVRGRPTIFAPGNLLRGLSAAVTFRPAGLRRQFSRRQRLQLGLADSNMCQLAEYLRIGTMMLVLDMAESGRLSDAPQLRKPRRALARLNRDPWGRATVEIRSAAPMDALSLQRWYQQRAATFTHSRTVVDLEAQQVVRLWDEVLSALASDPPALRGRLDWPTKAALLREAGADAGWAVQKKLDLKYHDLAGGYFQAMESAGMTEALVDAASILEAIDVPPDNTPAAERGRLVRQIATQGMRASISWHRVRIRSAKARGAAREGPDREGPDREGPDQTNPNRRGATVISLDAYRHGRHPEPDSER